MMKVNGDMTGSATFSEDCLYRYTLEREWKSGDGTCLFIMLNPSTATAEENDNTIRRCIGYAMDWGYQRLAVGNLFALRSTDPKGLLDVADPVGPDNDEWLQQLHADAAEAVGAWGATKWAQARGARVLEMFPDLKCLGTTAGGSPKHPLYLPKTLTPVEISPEERK